MSFEQPWAFLLLALIPLFAWMRLAGRSTAALRFWSLNPVVGIRQSWRAALSGVPFWMSLASCALLIFALARPQTGGRRVREAGRGAAIQILLDRSLSMTAPIELGANRLTRLDAAKRYLDRFVRGDGDKLKGRGSDLIGIIAFAQRAETVCPLTLSHAPFSGLLAAVQPADRTESGTAIGDALALAAARLKMPGAAGNSAPKSRAIVLLTDGENNAGTRSIEEAADLAKQWGVRVHAIAVVNPPPLRTSMLYRMRIETRYTAERELSALAQKTGGIYRGVYDSEGLQAVSAEIDKLEKTQLPVVRSAGAEDRAEPFLATAFALLVTAAVSSRTVFRRLP